MPPRSSATASPSSVANSRLSVIGVLFVALASNGCSLIGTTLALLSLQKRPLDPVPARAGQHTCHGEREEEHEVRSQIRSPPSDQNLLHRVAVEIDAVRKVTVTSPPVELGDRREGEGEQQVD